VIIWTFSDIHLEMSLWDLPADRPHCDVVVVAGDLISRAERGVAWLAARFPETEVVYVLGNHEYYGGDLDLIAERARQAAAGERVPPDGQRRICWVLELCSCHACARHARLVTDHRRPVNRAWRATANVGD
jgi:hypothetical protein